MDLELQSFIDEMRQKYSRDNIMGGMSVGQPPYLPVGDPRTGYTGDVPTNKPAGIVHGKEQIIEAPMVKAAGGPENIREAVENLAGEAAQQRIPGFQSGTGSGVVNPEKKKPVQTTVASQAVPSVNVAPKREVTTSTKFVTNLTPEQEKAAAAARGRASSAALSGAEAAGNQQQAAQGANMQQAASSAQTRAPWQDATPGPAEPAVPQSVIGRIPEVKYEPPAPIDSGDVKTGMESIRKTARGESEAQRLTEEQARSRQAGESAAEGFALSQQLAQRGIEGGAAAAAKARLRREQNIRASQENVELARQGAERQERAGERLFETGMAVEKFEESKKQFAKQFGLSEKAMNLNEAEFKENVRRFGLEKLWREHQYNNLSAAQKETFKLEGESIAESKKRYADSQWRLDVQDAKERGDVKALESLYKEKGMDVDMATVANDVQRKAYEDAMGSIELSIDNGALLPFQTADGVYDYKKAMSDPEFKAQLEQAAKQRGLEPGTPEYKKWAEEKLEVANLMGDQFYSAAVNFVGESAGEISQSLFGKDLANFTYAGQTGAKAVQLAVAAMYKYKALGMDESGDITIADKPLNEILGKTTETGSAETGTATETPKTKEHEQEDLTNPASATMQTSTGENVALRPDSSKLTREDGMKLIASKIGTESKAVNDRIKNSVDSIINNTYQTVKPSASRAENREKIISTSVEKVFGIKKQPGQSGKGNKVGIIYDFSGQGGSPTPKERWGKQTSSGLLGQKQRNKLNKDQQTVSLWSDLVSWGMTGEDAYAATSQLVGAELANNAIKKLFTQTEYEDIVAPKLGITISEEV